MMSGWLEISHNPKEERWQQLQLHHGLYQNSLLPQRLWPEYGKRRGFWHVGFQKSGWMEMNVSGYILCLLGCLLAILRMLSFKKLQVLYF